MAGRYRKTRRASNREGQRASSKRTSGQRPAKIVDREEALAGRVAVELPVSLAEVIDGVSEEIERLAAQAGLLIMREVMEAEVASRLVTRDSTFQEQHTKCCNTARCLAISRSDHLGHSSS